MNPDPIDIIVGVWIVTVVLACTVGIAYGPAVYYEWRAWKARRCEN